MAQDSKILFDKESWHNSVYFAGYTLEAYIKIILIHHEPEENFIGHLGDSDFLNKFRRLISLHPSFFNTSILKENSYKYPRRLFNGGGNNNTKAAWKIKSRYKVEHWQDKSFAEEIQQEVVSIQEALAQLRIDGVLS